MSADLILVNVEGKKDTGIPVRPERFGQPKRGSAIRDV